MFDLKETALINSEKPFAVEFKDKNGAKITKTYNKVSVYEVESIDLIFVNVTNKETGDSALWLSHSYSAVQHLSSKLDISYINDTVPTDISVVKFYDSSTDVIDIVVNSDLPIYLKTEYCRAKYGADIDITWVSTMQSYNGLKFSLDKNNAHTVKALDNTLYNDLKYTDAFCTIEKDDRYDNELVTIVYLKLDNSVIKYATPLMVDSSVKEMCEYVRKTVSDKIIGFNENSIKIIYGKKHVLLTLDGYMLDADYLTASCDETRKSGYTVFESLTPERLEELVFNVT